MSKATKYISYSKVDIKIFNKLLKVFSEKLIAWR